MLSPAGPRVLERYSDRLKEFNSAIRTMNGKVTPIAGVINMSIEMEGVAKVLSVKVVCELEHDLIFEMDFCQEFGIEVRFAEGH